MEERFLWMAMAAMAVDPAILTTSMLIMTSENILAIILTLVGRPVEKNWGREIPLIDFGSMLKIRLRPEKYSRNTASPRV